MENKFKKLETKTIEEISKSVISFGAYSLTSFIEWQNSGVPYINVGDIHDGYIDFSGVKYISEKVIDKFRHKIHKSSKPMNIRLAYAPYRINRKKRDERNGQSTREEHLFPAKPGKGQK